jgi:hypothetical protein
LSLEDAAGAAARRRLGVLTAAVALVVLAGAVGIGLGRSGSSARSGDWVTVPAARAAPEPEPSGPPPVRISAVGDVIMGSTPALPPQGGRTFFDGVRSELRGDIVMGNFEGALTNRTYSAKCEPDKPAPSPSPASNAPKGCFAFRMPPSYAGWLRGAGFTMLNIANNHARDYGSGGLADTRAALTAQGVATTGGAGEIPVLTVGGTTVAVLGFSPYPWTNSVIDVPAAEALVKAAVAKADLVVVNMHAGGEGSDRTHVRPGTETFLGENRGDPIRFARALVDAGADLVVGHSPHVMRGMEWYRGRLIAYSLGNFAGYRVLSTAGVLGVGAILHVALRPDGSWADGSLTATRMINRGLPAVDPAREAFGLVDRLSVADLGASACRVPPSGALRPPG